MGMYERLLGEEEPKLPVHQFMSALGEYERKAMTLEQIYTAFGLSTSEQAELVTLAAQVSMPLESYPLPGRVTLTNVGAVFDDNIDSRSLPFFYVEKAGIIRMNVEILHRKAGTGVHEYQLWDDTAGMAVLDNSNITTGSLIDSLSAGDHKLTAERILTSPLPPGTARLRLRVRSTVAADDPIYMGGAATLARPSMITSWVLHEILCLAEQKIVPYETVALVKTRLGV